MAEELAYVLINPYTIIKSRTGGVIGRILSRSGAELFSARMFSPSPELVKEYADAVGSVEDKDHPDVNSLIKEYLLENYMPDKKTGQRRRVMFLLFKGEDAIRRLQQEVIGHITKETIAGETVRDTYGDYVLDSNGGVKYFEPAVMIATNAQSAEQELKIWAKYSEKDSGFLKDVINYKPGIKPENTLVMIKPDCFQWPSSKPGTIIDTFSRTGLYIIGAKVIRMSIKQALEFYGPVKEVLLKKFGDPNVADEQFNKIIRFMTGLDSTWVVSEKQRETSGQVKCLALIYQGEDAVSKIRNVLGATDPSKAAPSTVRKEFGKDVLVNTAHASDSVENAVREMGIIKIEENDLKKIIDEFYR
jgi:nucleoside diphosphate kinase